MEWNLLSTTYRAQLQQLCILGNKTTHKFEKND